MKSAGKRLTLCVILLVLNVCFIWGNSLLPGEVSGAFSDWVKAFLQNIFPFSGGASEGRGLLRKMAHFSEFAALGMCLSWLFRLLGKNGRWALLCGFFVACVDETIQRFVPGRGPSFIDVSIDTCGVLTGMLMLFVGYHYYKKIKFKGVYL